VIAGVISRSLGADLFEIEPAKPYPADYFETVELARQERDSGYEPALKARIPDIAAYQMIFLCFPIWGETAPPVIRSFLTAHDLSAKTLVPVITHGGYGLGSSLAVLRSHAPTARLLDGFTMQGSPRHPDRLDHQWRQALVASGASGCRARRRDGCQVLRTKG
jgi:flavodoxin